MVMLWGAAILSEAKALAIFIAMPYRDRSLCSA